MVRANIFDILALHNDMEKEANRLITLFERKALKISMGIYDAPLFLSLKEYVSDHLFRYWNGKGHCIDANDFFACLNYDEIKRKAPYEFEAFLQLIEIISNFIQIAAKYNYKARYCDDNEIIVQTRTLINDIVASYNHALWYYESNEKIIIYEDKPEITAAAEIVAPELAADIVRYNHYSSKGDLKIKRQILTALGRELEAKRAMLSKHNSSLENAVFAILNNMGIRHNNIHNQEVIKAFTDEEMEYWYDELYQMILLATLEIDNAKRLERYVSELKPRIT